MEDNEPKKRNTGKYRILDEKFEIFDEKLLFERSLSQWLVKQLSLDRLWIQSIFNEASIWFQAKSVQLYLGKCMRPAQKHTTENKER